MKKFCLSYGILKKNVFTNAERERERESALQCLRIIPK